MADIINCRTATVGGRVYRVWGSAETFHAHAPDRGEHAVGTRWQQDEENEEAAQAAGEEDALDESLITQEGNQFVARLSCDADVLPFIIGREGRTKKRIEGETGAQLVIPRRPPGAGPQQQQQQQQAQQGGDITIRGPSRAAVSSAYVRAQVVMSEALAGRLLDYNHFISLPLATPAAVRQFEAFRRAVLADPAAASRAGLEESVFMKPQHLHLTLVMLKLYSDEQRYAAKQALERLRAPLEELVRGEPLKVHLQALEYMNDDPSAMHVLFLKVHDMGPGSRLEALCDMVVAEFSRAGLLLPQDDRKVKLHATVLNTRYRKRSGPAPAGDGPSGRQERKPFDGRALLQEHGQLDLGIHAIEAVHLSQRGAYGADGYYNPAAVLRLTG